MHGVPRSLSECTHTNTKTRLAEHLEGLQGADDASGEGEGERRLGARGGLFTVICEYI